MNIEQIAKQCGAEFTDWQNGEPPEITFYGGMPQLESFSEALREAIIKDYQQSTEYEAMKADAERYRWLREQTWTSDSLCVVTCPSKAIRLGYDCPSTDRLDQAIDQARKQSEG